MTDCIPSDPKLWNTVRAYLAAKATVIENGYAEEIDWQDSLSFEMCTESMFLREMAWVILSSGMRESVVRRKFLDISGAFFGWDSSAAIAEDKDECRNEALRHFNHKGKIDAIVTIAEIVSDSGFESFRLCVETGGADFLSQLPFLGPATSLHLAKNLGFQVAKPDRHLLRIAEAAGYSSPQQMCSDISSIVCDRVPVVDLVLWRYATLTTDYLNIFPTAGLNSFEADDCGLCWLH